MARPGKTPAIIISVLIFIFGVIHLGVGAGIVSKYHQYSDIFQQPIGICAFNIVIGIYAIIIGALCLLAVIRERPDWSKSVAVCSVILGVFAIASLIAALIINSHAINFLRGRLLYRVDTYISSDSSINIMDKIQTRYQCCGVNLWLDWGLVGLGSTESSGSGGGTIIVSGAGTSAVSDTAVSTRPIQGHRRRDLNVLSSALAKAVRRRRKTSGTTVYNLPSSYNINLPLSCCKDGGSSTGNSVGVYCVFSADNGTNSFYVEGCLSYVGDRVVSQITGVAVINVFLAILSIVLVPILRNMFPQSFDPNNPVNKQPLPYHPQQEQQMQNEGYYGNSNMNPPAYYNYPQQQSVYVTYQ